MLAVVNVKERKNVSVFELRHGIRNEAQRKKEKKRKESRKCDMRG